MSKPTQKNAPKKKSTQPDFVLNLDGFYKDFTDFYGKNKETIYRSILNLFVELKTTTKDSLTLMVTAKIKGLEWDTDFTFSKKDAKSLIRDVMPFFEQNEDYETCSEIIKLHKDLTNSKN